MRTSQRRVRRSVPRGHLGDSVGYAPRESAENGIVGPQNLAAAVGYATPEGGENGVIDSPDLSVAVGNAPREAGENDVVRSMVIGGAFVLAHRGGRRKLAA